MSYWSCLRNGTVTLHEFITTRYVCVANITSGLASNPYDYDCTIPATTTWDVKTGFNHVIQETRLKTFLTDPHRPKPLTRSLERLGHEGIGGRQILSDCPFCPNPVDDEGFDENEGCEHNLALLKCRANWERLTAPAGTPINTQGVERGEECKNQLPMAEQGIITSLKDALEVSVGGISHVYSIDNAGESLKPYRHPEIPCLYHARFLEAMDRQIQEEASALVDNDSDDDDDNKAYHPIIPVVVGRFMEQWGGPANSNTHGRIQFLGTTKSGIVFDAAIQRPWQGCYAPHLPLTPSSHQLDTYYSGEASNFILLRATVQDYDPLMHSRPFKSFLSSEGTPPPLMGHSLLIRVYNTWLPISRRPETVWRAHFDLKRFSPIAETMMSYALKEFQQATAWGDHFDQIQHGNGDSSPSGSEVEIGDFLPCLSSWTTDEDPGEHSWTLTPTVRKAMGWSCRMMKETMHWTQQFVATTTISADVKVRDYSCLHFQCWPSLRASSKIEDGCMDGAKRPRSSVANGGQAVGDTLDSRCVFHTRLTAVSNPQTSAASP
ncbi:hypothetical protein BD410DRAFT_810460 [Rickenella mellea]|uniref:Uncharacterized protein n=1 Tax=Rickenella mellea TaxID=50990 RepID=A0A4Y7PDZ5_9AGAM|nr:hypothetical protein BD410DRAFT_810460 [Rickenella mellea]